MMIGWGGGLIVMALVIWLIITLVNRTGNNFIGSPNVPKNTPLEILKERYARGEVTKEEFDEMAKNLR